MFGKLKKTLKNELKGFKDFAIKDNAITLAVGVIIGVAFKDLVDSLVKNIFTPPIGYLTADLDFSNLFVTLGAQQYETLEEAQAVNAVVIQYGLVLNALITFVITAIILYFIVRAMNRAVKKEERKVERTTRKCPYCKSEISRKASKCAFCTSSVKPMLDEKE